MDGKTEKRNLPDEGLSRREFLKRSQQIFIGAGVCGILPGMIMTNDAIAAIPAAGGYILVDRKKCQGCVTCMLACSLAHEGAESLSISRIQIVQNSFGKFPDDLDIAQCRQCVEAPCVNACQNGALSANPRYGNVRMVNAEKCIGCKSCVEACPYPLARAVWDAETKKACVCDLCAETPYWNQTGGPGGKQVCIEICPVGALEFTSRIPVQEGEQGYEVNLRGESWKKLGYPID